MSKAIPLRPENELFTDSQWQAVFDGEENILVSASAGSGKTTVLVRRVIEKLKDGAQIDRLLIVTYTEAAAKEMKERIQIALQEAISNESEGKKKQHFIRQLALLPTANISTLHAFCLTVIRRFYYLIELDPIFRLLTDETEMLLLKEDVWDDLRESFYAEEDARFYQLTANFSNDRTDDGLTTLIFSLYDFARANPDPNQWLEQLPNFYRFQENLGDSSLVKKYLKPSLMESLLRCVARYEEMIQLTEGEEKLAKITDLARDEKEWAESFASQLADNDLEQAYELSQVVTFARYPSIRIEELKEVASIVKQLREQNKKSINDTIKKLFSMSPDEMKTVLKAAQPIVEKMAHVEQKFIACYSQEKLKKGLVDFNDLEHYTLAILRQKKEEQWVGSEASAYYREKFDEVLVDEYQDVNQLQETILYWLRRPLPGQNNLFMVGDVKQSIYSFRLADPTLFIEKYEQYGKEQDGRRIILSENFRSRKPVLDFTNLIFEQLMDVSVGQIEYNHAAKLVYGFDQFPESSQYDPEVLIYEKQPEMLTQETEAALFQEDIFLVEDKTEGELYMTACKIHELIEQKFPIYDKKSKKNRPLEYRDIVLLTPTKKNNLTILEIFKEIGIPIQVNDAQNYFQATEIQTMISLLQIIDNPYQDIPLAAVLRSPIVGLKENELVQIRLADKKNTYFDALLKFSEAEDNLLYSKVALFLKRLDKWRDSARNKQLATFLWEIYQDTAYLDYVSGMPEGKQRQANLFALVDRAANYEKTSFRGLFQFVRFIEKMREKDKDLAEPVIFSEENSVRVMTIHASKGLEFPVVFVLDMSKEFNLSDLNTRYIFDERLGAGIRYLEPTDRILYDTLPFLAIKQEKQKKLLSEEMRKLYVALTRAEQKLFLVGSYKDEASLWKEWLQVADVKTPVLPSETRLQGKNSFMNWVGMSLIRHEKMADYQHNQVVANVAGITNHPASFTLHFFKESNIKKYIQEIFTTGKSSVQEKLPKTAPKDVALALTRLQYMYPYEVATQTTNYQSVSEIKRVFEDPDTKALSPMELDGMEKMQPIPMIVHRMADGELGKPSFIEQTRHTPSATEIGTATHYVFQLFDLTQTPTESAIEALIEQLVDSNIIQKNVANYIDKSAILAFYQTSFGQLLLKEPKNVRRERPFSMLLNADRLIKDYPKMTEDDLLIHGIIDGYIEEENTIRLYDYKTDGIRDRTDKKEIEKVIKRYAGQLKLYKKALVDATGKEVKQVLIILLSAKLIIDIENNEIIDQFS